MNNQVITKEQLQERLTYNREEGLFRWRQTRSRTVKVGDVAGTRGDGYVGIILGGKRYYAHRLAWLYVYGEFPKNQIDHINGDKRDNRIENLRLCVDGENQQNRAANRNNKTGLIGVSWSKKSQKWQAQIGLHGKTMGLGVFSCQFDAHNAYLEAKKQIHTFNPTPRNKGV